MSDPTTGYSVPIGASEDENDRIRAGLVRRMQEEPLARCASSVLSDAEIAEILASPRSVPTLDELAAAVCAVVGHVLALTAPERLPDGYDIHESARYLIAISSDLGVSDCSCATLGYAMCDRHQREIADAMWPGER